MNLEDFNPGTRHVEADGATFSPTFINRAWTWHDPAFNVLLEKTASALAELSGFSLAGANIRSFETAHILKEATATLRMGGETLTLENTLRNVSLKDSPQYAAPKKVGLFVKALKGVLMDSKDQTFSLPLIKTLHAILTGRHAPYASPSPFRTTAALEEPLKGSLPIPASAHQIDALMRDMEAFWHNDSFAVPFLIRIALVHYQCATVQPFLNSNGALTYLLTLFLLIKAGFAVSPWLCLADTLHQHQKDYASALMRAQTEGKIIPWVLFFLNGLCQAAEHAKSRLLSLLALHATIDERLNSLKRRSLKAHQLLSSLYQKPFINASLAASALQMTPASVNALLKAFENLKIVRNLTGSRRHRLFVFEDYIHLITHRLRSQR